LEEKSCEFVTHKHQYDKSAKKRQLVIRFFLTSLNQIQTHDGDGGRIPTIVVEDTSKGKTIHQTCEKSNE
jgi:hypothetical protein